MSEPTTWTDSEGTRPEVQEAVPGGEPVPAAVATWNMRDVPAAPEGALDLDGPDRDDSDLVGDSQWNRPSVGNRVTSLLLVTTLLVAAFGTGIWVQRRQTQTSTSAAASGLPGTLPAGFNPGSLPAGFPSGGFGGGGFPATGGTGSSGSTGAGPTGAAGSTSGVGSSLPVVVGTITSVAGSSLTVKNLGDQVVAVTIPDTARVTTLGVRPLASGMTVSVSGAKRDDGSVVATEVVVRASS